MPCGLMCVAGQTVAPLCLQLYERVRVRLLSGDQRSPEVRFDQLNDFKKEHKLVSDTNLIPVESIWNRIGFLLPSTALYKF